MSTPNLTPDARRLRDRLDERRTRELRKLTSLLQVSQALSGTLDLRPALQEIFGLFVRHHEALGSLVVLGTRENRELQIEAAGLGRPGHQASLLAGPGPIGKVIESGRHVVIPRLSLSRRWRSSWA